MSKFNRDERATTKNILEDTEELQYSVDLSDDGDSSYSDLEYSISDLSEPCLTSEYASDSSSESDLETSSKSDKSEESDVDSSLSDESISDESMPDGLRPFDFEPVCSAQELSEDEVSERERMMIRIKTSKNQGKGISTGVFVEVAKQWRPRLRACVVSTQMK